MAYNYKDTIFVVPSTSKEKIQLEVSSEILCFIQNKTFKPDHVKVFDINEVNDLDKWLMKNTFYFSCEIKLNRDKNGQPRLLNNIQITPANSFFFISLFGAHKNKELIVENRASLSLHSACASE